MTVGLNYLARYDQLRASWIARIASMRKSSRLNGVKLGQIKNLEIEAVPGEHLRVIPPDRLEFDEAFMSSMSLFPLLFEGTTVNHFLDS